MKPTSPPQQKPMNSPIPSAKGGTRQKFRFAGSSRLSGSSKGVALLACAFALAHGSPASAALLVFEGEFDPSNWTLFVSNGGDGFVTTTGAPFSISLTSSNNGGGGGDGPFVPMSITAASTESNVDYTILAPSTGSIAFYWSYVTSDLNPSYDPFFFLWKNTATKLSDDEGANQQSGFASFALEMGDTFGFRQGSIDSTGGFATTTISSSAPSAIPEPGSMLALGLLMGGGAFMRSRRRRPQDA